METQEQTGQEESQGTQTQETQEKSSQQEQHKETKKASETDSKKAEFVAEGERKAMKKVAEAIGVKASNLDLNQLAEAVQAKKAADDAKKTAEERLAEVGNANKAISEENEALKSLIGKRADADFNSLSEEAKGFVSEFAGEDPIARMKYMGSESFQKLVGKAQGPRTQGGLKNSPETGEKPDGFKGRFEAMKNEADPYKRREMAKSLQGESGNKLASSFDSYFEQMGSK